MPHPPMLLCPGGEGCLMQPDGYPPHGLLNTTIRASTWAVNYSCT